ncbi:MULTISPECIES: FtsX-like permease family protein [Streptomyces]|uniref:FtsX-like permease family protein n=2 Tax=Streptomyces TaxID=1883 RepID=A0ABU4K4A8_9ACTN|nr:FtsX-like permease family protein [Streptomyces roseolus]MDX2292575.1 FtsX-like permease family protein [Streptomyces roseolus]
MNDGVALLAARSLLAHRRAWTAVFAAVALVSALLGALALTAGSLGLAHARVERYAAAPVVVTGDQEARFTATPWGGEPQTASAGLTERVRVPAAAADALRALPGVRAVVPDDVFRVREHTGRPWDAARLGGHRLTAGRAPAAPGEAVAGGAPDRLGRLVAGYRVVGVADGPRALYFGAADARRLAGHPGTHDALGVLGEPGVPVDTLHARVRHALDTAPGTGGKGLRALTGDGRGAAEDLRALPARDGLLQLLAAVAGTVVLVTVLVLTSLVAQALAERAPERALLHAVGAAPRQIRAAVGREVTRVAGTAALLGALGAVPAFLLLRSTLAIRGALPPALELPAPPWLYAALLVTAGLTLGLARLVVPLATSDGRRAGRAGRRSGAGRRGAGLVMLVLGAGAAGTATLQSGEAAGAAAGAATVTLVAGCALLGPWIAAAAMRVAGPVLRRSGGAAGHLVAAGTAARSRALGAALTPVVLVTAFAGVQLAAGSTADREAAAQARAATVAGHELVPRAGDAPTTAELRRLPGVTSATGVLRSTVVLAGTEAGSPRLDRLPVLGVDPEGLAGTLDPGVVAGDLAGLARPGTVAVGADRADALGVRPGSTVELRMGDGTPRRLTVVAVYARSLALGEFLFPRDGLAPHMTDPVPARVLLAGPGAARVPGARPAAGPERVEADEAAAGAVLSVAAVAAIGVLTVLSVLSTLRLLAAGRRAELALLAQVGASRRQLRSTLLLEAGFLAGTGLLLGAVVAALPLAAFAWALTGGPPYLPPAQAALIAGTVLVTTYAGVLGGAGRGAAAGPVRR